MHVTRAVDYGLRALVLMARQPAGARSMLRQLADGGAVPRNYLVKVLKSLSRGGLVRSQRGVKGGFVLTRAPREITLRQVVEAVDGPVAIVPCLNGGLRGGGPCPRSGRCAGQVVFRAARDRMTEELDRHTLEDIAALQRQFDAPAAAPAEAVPPPASGS